MSVEVVSQTTDSILTKEQYCFIERMNSKIGNGDYSCKKINYFVNLLF